MKTQSIVWRLVLVAVLLTAFYVFKHTPPANDVETITLEIAEALADSPEWQSYPEAFKKEVLACSAENTVEYLNTTDCKYEPALFMTDKQKECASKYEKALGTIAIHCVHFAFEKHKSEFDKLIQQTI